MYSSVQIHQVLRSVRILHILFLVNMIFVFCLYPGRAASLRNLAPSDGSVDLSSTTRLEIKVPEETQGPATVAFYGRSTNPTSSQGFTIVVLPDTQFYSENSGVGSIKTFKAQTDWIAKEWAARNIVFVTHLGDCVEHGDNNGNPVEWRRAADAMYTLEAFDATFLPSGIPYGIAVGNHDQSPYGSARPGSTVMYNRFFGVQHFAGRPYYGGHLGKDNDNHYELFSANGMDFIVIHLEYDEQTYQKAIAWADDLLSTHSKSARDSR